MQYLNVEFRDFIRFIEILIIMHVRYNIYNQNFLEIDVYCISYDYFLFLLQLVIKFWLMICLIEFKNLWSQILIQSCNIKNFSEKKFIMIICLGITIMLKS